MTTLRHGMTGTPTHDAWKQMRYRCNNPKSARYKDYGGRGIKICRKWDVFEVFLKDMGSRPRGMSIERIDNSKGYSKSNCRWATDKEQSRNKRNSRFITIDGVKKILSDWAAVSPVDSDVIHRRISRGWTAKDAVFTPAQSRIGNILGVNK